MSYQFTPQQSLFITYAKALAIVTVVIGHYNWVPLDIYDPYIYHMPLFFIIAGIVSKPICSIKRWLKDCFTKYILYIVIWYSLIGLATLFINHTFGTNILLGFVDSGRFNPIEFSLRTNMHWNSLFMVGWFLVTLFLSYNIFKVQLTIMVRYLPQKYLPSISLIIGLLIGYLAVTEISPLFDLKRYWSQQQTYWLYNFACQIGVAYMYLSIGYTIKKYLNIFASFSLFALSILLMFTFVGNETFHPLGMSWSQYPDGFAIHLLSSLLGCFTLLYFAHLLSLAVNNSLLKAIGQCSKDIMSMHMLAFVMIDLLMVNLGYFEYDKIMALTHYESASMWPLYICFALFMPISVRILIKQVKSVAPSELKHYIGKMIPNGICSHFKAHKTVKDDFNKQG